MDSDTLKAMINEINREYLEKYGLKPGVADLGWANGWEKEPEIVSRCRGYGHKVSRVDNGPPHRGLDNVVQCEICWYKYHVDSSD